MELGNRGLSEIRLTFTTEQFGQMLLLKKKFKKQSWEEFFYDMAISHSKLVEKNESEILAKNYKEKLKKVIYEIVDEIIEEYNIK